MSSQGRINAIVVSAQHMAIFFLALVVNDMRNPAKLVVLPLSSYRHFCNQENLRVPVFVFVIIVQV